MMFSVGFVVPSLQIHLDHYGADELEISLCFVFLMTCYAIFCLVGAAVYKKVDDRVIILSGIILLAISYIMISPWHLIFPKSIIMVICSLPILGLGWSMIYCNYYLVPTFPHMLKNANKIYKFEIDDVLTDTLAGLSNMSCNLGEILGPVVSGVLIDFVGFEMTGNIVAVLSIMYAVVYFLFSGLIMESRKVKTHNAKLISTIDPGKETSMALFD